jgi:lipopolysaccharide transport system ATP-binding protein
LAVIEFEHVSKIYHLGQSRIGLRDAIPILVKKMIKRDRADKMNQVLFSALDDVSFEVEEGEVLGIIGHNGAGKSTILKLLSRVTYPNSGQIHTRGRLAALIELGAGFHPDLSGRDNIYLNGSVLGLKRQEINAQFSDIVEFAGLEKFIDTPVKRYSSGMYVRLAFSVAAHVKADLLLVDEVLSVGDMSFQRKCLAKMNELRDSGATIVFISHNLQAVQSFCSRVILLDSGKIAANGSSDEVFKVYQHLTKQSYAKAISEAGSGSNLVMPVPEDYVSRRILEVKLFNQEGRQVDEISSDEPNTVQVFYDFLDPMYSPQVRFKCHKQNEEEIIFRIVLKDPACNVLVGRGVFETHIEPLRLASGTYYLETNIHDANESIYIDAIPIQFHVLGKLDDSEAVFFPHAFGEFHHEKTE